jgi:hypothetical protein
VTGFANRIGSTDGENQTARFYNPYGIAFLPSGELAIADAYNETIRNATPPAEIKLQLSRGGALTLHWNAIIGKTYQLQSAAPTLDAWFNFGNLLTASNQTAAIVLQPEQTVTIFRLQTSR